MLQVSVNLWFVILAAIVNMVIGALWYSPTLFAGQWLKSIGKKSNEMRQPGPLYVLSGLVALIEAYVMAHIIAYAGATSVGNGAVTGAWVWLGFVLPVVTVITVFEGRGRDYWLITAGYHLLVLLVIGALLAGHSHVVA